MLVRPRNLCMRKDPKGSFSPILVILGPFWASFRHTLAFFGASFFSLFLVFKAYFGAFMAIYCSMNPIWGNKSYTMSPMIHVWRMVTDNCVWRNILKCCACRLISIRRQMHLMCDFKKLRLTPTRRQPDVNQTRPDIFRSGARCNISKSCVFCDLPPTRVVPSCWQVN